MLRQDTFKPNTIFRRLRGRKHRLDLIQDAQWDYIEYFPRRTDITLFQVFSGNSLSGPLRVVGMEYIGSVRISALQIVHGFIANILEEIVYSKTGR